MRKHPDCHWCLIENLHNCKQHWIISQIYCKSNQGLASFQMFGPLTLLQKTYWLQTKKHTTFFWHIGKPRYLGEEPSSCLSIQNNHRKLYNHKSSLCSGKSQKWKWDTFQFHLPRKTVLITIQRNMQIIEENLRFC